MRREFLVLAEGRSREKNFRFSRGSLSGGARHDPQRCMGKTVTVPHFNRDTVESASRKRNESNPGIKKLLPFPKNIREESDFENFQDLIVALDACYWLHKTIFVIRRRTCDLADFER